MWLGHSRVETWHDSRYDYDCRLRAGLSHVVVQMTLQGAAYYQGRRGRQIVGPGQAFIDVIPGPFNYGYASEHGEPYKLVYAALVGGEARKWAMQIIRRFGHVLEIGLDSHVHTLLMAMAHQKRAGSSSQPDRYTVSGQVYQLFMALLSQLTQSRLSQTPRIGDAMGLIRSQAANPDFTVQTLAGQIGCSREYLTRQFRHATGLTPSMAIIQHRLDMACVLLRQDSAKLDNVARACGFASANYFCRLFRQRLGVSPGQYRSQPQMVLHQPG